MRPHGRRYRARTDVALVPSLSCTARSNGSAMPILTVFRPRHHNLILRDPAGLALGVPATGLWLAVRPQAPCCQRVTVVHHRIRCARSSGGAAASSRRGRLWDLVVIGWGIASPLLLRPVGPRSDWSSVRRIRLLAWMITGTVLWTTILVGAPAGSRPYGVAVRLGSKARPGRWAIMAGPPPGYQRPTERFGGSGRGAVVTAAVCLSLVVLKPESAGVVPPRQDAKRRRRRTVQRPLRERPPSVRARPPWPAGGAASLQRRSRPRPETGSMISDDVLDRGAPGGGHRAAHPPRGTLDEVDRGASREPSPGEPSRVATRPSTDVCDRLPVLPDRPSVVAVTTPAAMGVILTSVAP